MDNEPGDITPGMSEYFALRDGEWLTYDELNACTLAWEAKRNVPLIRRARKLASDENLATLTGLKNKVGTFIVSYRAALAAFD